MGLLSQSTVNIQSVKGCHKDRLTAMKHLERRKASRTNNRLDEEVSTSRGEGISRTSRIREVQQSEQGCVGIRLEKWRSLDLSR